MSENRKNYLQLHPEDNVLVALTDIPMGTSIKAFGKEIVTKEDIPAKHKIFGDDLSQDGEIIMYGVLVGKTQVEVKRGSLMKTSNTYHAAEPYRYRSIDYKWQRPDISKFEGRNFNGYHRKDGKVGTANYWLFIPTVFCENRNLDVIKEALHHSLGYASTDKYINYANALAKALKNGNSIEELNLSPADHQQDRLFKNIDGIKFLNHQGGCGGTRQDSDTLSKLLAAYADHPNVAGVTLLSLGCQHLQTQDFLEDVKKHNPLFEKTILVFEQQQSLSEENLIKEAIHHTFLGLVKANEIER